MPTTIELIHFLYFFLCSQKQKCFHFTSPSIFIYISWVWPLPSSSDHQDYYIFSRVRPYKPFFATGILGRGHTQYISNHFFLTLNHPRPPPPPPSTGCLTVLLQFIEQLSEAGGIHLSQLTNPIRNTRVWGHVIFFWVGPGSVCAWGFWPKNICIYIYIYFDVYIYTYILGQLSRLGVFCFWVVDIHNLTVERRMLNE